MMRHNSAKTICSHWHSGQWSALYQFASSGIYTKENHLRYLQEIESCLHPEYNLHSGKLSKRDEGNLIGLKWYFIRMGEKNHLFTDFATHPVYGYLIPYLTDKTPDYATMDIKPLQYLK